MSVGISLYHIDNFEKNLQINQNIHKLEFKELYVSLHGDNQNQNFLIGKKLCANYVMRNDIHKTKTEENMF